MKWISSTQNWFTRHLYGPELRDEIVDNVLFLYFFRHYQLGLRLRATEQTWSVHTGLKFNTFGYHFKKQDHFTKTEKISITVKCSSFLKFVCHFCVLSQFKTRFRNTWVGLRRSWETNEFSKRHNATQERHIKHHDNVEYCVTRTNNNLKFSFICVFTCIVF